MSVSLYVAGRHPGITCSVFISRFCRNTSKVVCENSPETSFPTRFCTFYSKIFSILRTWSSHKIRHSLEVVHKSRFALRQLRNLTKLKRNQQTPPCRYSRRPRRGEDRDSNPRPHADTNASSTDSYSLDYGRGLNQQNSLSKHFMQPTPPFF